jgi:hypothetical protein
VSSPTPEAPLTTLNLDDNNSFSDEGYIEPTVSIAADHLAKWCKYTFKTLNQNLTDLPELPTFDRL